MAGSRLAHVRGFIVLVALRLIAGCASQQTVPVTGPAGDALSSAVPALDGVELDVAFSTTTIEPANTLIAELARDWSRPQGGQLLDIMVPEALPPVFSS